MSLEVRLPEHVAVTFPRHYAWLAENASFSNTGELLVLCVDLLYRVLAIAEYLLNRGVRIVTVDYLPRKVLSKLKLDLSLIESILVRVLLQIQNFSARIYLFDYNSYLTVIRFHPEDANRLLNIVVGYDHRAELRYMLLRALMSGEFYETKLTMDTVESFVTMCKKYLTFERDPDLLIVFGDECTPDFLVYNVSYSELVFIDKMLYDVTISDLETALEAYQRRARRFGR